MEEPSLITLRPSFRCFELWSAILVGSVVGFCALYHVAWPLFDLDWPFSHPIRDGRVAEFIGYSALTCSGLALFMVLFFIVPASIIYALQRAWWEASPEGVAIYRKGNLSRKVPWGVDCSCTRRTHGRASLFEGESGARATNLGPPA
jgi:hypothetical protein